MARKLFIAALALLLALGLLLGLALWLAGREATLQWLVERGVEASGGSLVIDQVQGVLRGPLRIGRIVYRKDGAELVATDVLLDWSPRALWNRQLDIKQLHVGSAALRLPPPTDKPLTLPESLAVPFDIALREVKISRAAIRRENFSTRVADIALTAVGGRRAWQGQVSSLHTQWGNVVGRFDLGADAPFPLGAEIGVTQLDAPSYSGRAVLTGTLADIAADIAAELSGVTATANLTLTPFRPVQLQDMRAQARGIDPHAWRSALPSADLTVELDAHGIEEKSFTGDVVVRNAAAAVGKLDQEKLPLREARAKFSGNTDVLQLPAIEIDLGDAGQLRGDGRWRDQQLELALTTTALNLRGAHGKLRQTQLAGDIRVVSGAATQSILANLSEDRYRFVVDASLTDKIVHVNELHARAGDGELFLQGELALDDRRAFDLKSKLTRFDPAQFGDYPKALINGRINANGSLTPQPSIAGALIIYDSRIFGEPLSASGKLATDGDQLSGGDLLVRLGRTRLEMDGRIALSTTREFKATGKIERLNPAQFAKFLGKEAGSVPQALINCGFDVRGQLSPQWKVAAEFRTHDSSIANQPLNADGRLNATRDRISDAKIILSAGRNRLQVAGAFGARQDRLQWRIAAPELNTFGRDFGGTLNAEGSLAGTLQSPAVAFSADAEKLMLFSEYRIARFSGRGELANGLSGTLDADFQASAIATPKIVLRSARLVLAGTRERHTVMVNAGNDTLDLSGALSGSWRDDTGWKGTIDRLSNSGAYPATLRAPAPLAFHQDKFSLKNATVEFADGVFVIETLEKGASAIKSRGSISKFPASYLIALADSGPSKLPLSSSLRLGGNWSLTAAEAADGQLRVWRENGDLTLTTEPRLPLGLNRLMLEAKIDRNRVNGAFSMGSTIATAEANATTAISQRDGAWGVAGDAPLTLQANADLPSLDWLAMFIKQPGIDLGGSLQIKLTGNGTLREPELHGTLRGETLQVQLPEYGVDLKNGSLRAEFAGQRLVIQQLVMHAGDGRINAEGSMGWQTGAPTMQLAIDVTQFKALASRDRQLVVSGVGNIALADKKLDVDGKLHADHGLIVLPKQDAPTLSDDVVIVGSETKGAAKSYPLQAHIDVHFDLGDDFYLRGRGLDAKLGGALQVRAMPEQAPTADGRITAGGTYAAYNQRLSIERGILTFAGPINNPALDILAVRKVPEIERDAVEAGIAITGTAIAPRAQLVSTPNVPDAEKLSWLVSGHGLESGSGAEISVLSAAAEGLLGGGESASLQSQITRTTGLDEVAIKSGAGLEKSVLALGKRLSSRVYVNYEQSLTGAANLVKINYSLTPRWSVRGTAGGDSAVDLFYSFSFD